VELPPTLEQFREHAREAFGFLVSDLGFKEARPPFENTNPFLVCFTNGSLHVFVEGEAWGTVASITFEDGNLRRASIGSLLSWYEPSLLRRKSKKGERPLSQLEQMSRDARMLKQYGSRLLGSDKEEFERIWSVLKQMRPSYQRARKWWKFWK
jgi:hypothetical protein